MKNVETEELFPHHTSPVVERRRKLARHIVPGLWIKTISVLKGRRIRVQHFPSSRWDEISSLRLPGTLSPANFRSSAGAKKTTSL
jgi:hypothetical protein